LSTEANTALVRRIIEAFLLRGRVERVDDSFAPGFVPFGRRVGPDRFRRLVSALRAAFPDMTGVIEHRVAEGDLVVCALTVQGSQRGAFAFPQVGILPPTGQSFCVRHCHRWRVVEGRIVAHWAVRDELGQLAQLGHLTLPAP
jgi:predicted ester cyclase